MNELKLLPIKIKYHDTGMERIEQIPQGNWIDLRTEEKIHLEKGDYRKISLGVSMQLPYGYEAIIAPRSSTFERYGILLANCIGIIDESYCGDDDIWRFPAYATRMIDIPAGTRICQFRIIEHQPAVELVEVEHLGNRNRSGFGSTGL